MKRKELVTSSGYWTADIQIKLYNAIDKFMKENKMNRTKLAEHLGVSKGYVSQILNGDFDHKISKLVDLVLAIGKIPNLCLENKDKFIEDDDLGIAHIMERERPKIFLNVGVSMNFSLENKKISTFKQIYESQSI